MGQDKVTIEIITTFASNETDKYRFMYNDIIQLLDQHRLKEAFVQLQALAEETDSWELKSQVENLQTTYGYMLQYAAQGMNDPERSKMYVGMHRTGYELADRIEFIRKYKKEYGHYGDKFRSSTMSPLHTISELQLSLETISEDLSVLQFTENNPILRQQKIRELAQRREQTLDELFDRVWTSPFWKEDDFTAAQALVDSVMLPANDLAVIISAATLNLLRIFDPLKFRFLINAFLNHSDVNVTQRALVGILLTAYYQDQRLSLYPDLSAIFPLYAENEKTLQMICSVQLFFLLSRETEKIDKRMREEIIPQMMRSSKLMNPDTKIIDIEDLEELEDKNPEWNKELDQIKDHIVELGQLQMEGADTYMSTFSHLKSYPFFRQAAHWFYPFDKNNSAVSFLFRNEDKSSIIDALIGSTMFCNSDKYSFCLSLSSLPEKQREMLSMQMIDMNNSKEELKMIEEDSKNASKPSVVCRQYIQDLYRFLKLWMFRNEEKDIFKDKIDLWNTPLLKPVLDQPEQLIRIAGHLFNKEYYQEAADVYIRLSQTKKDDPEIWQKLGFSLQKLKQYPEAIQAMKEADILKPDNVWTLKHMAQCYKRMHLYEEALEYFQKVETMQPDNLNLLLQIGQCLATLRRYDKALSYFFKVEYLEKAPANAQRAIGWCYFMTGKYDDSLRFYNKLTSTDKAQTSDWLNTGHVYLAQGNIPKAIEAYKEAEKLCESHDAFLKLFLADKEALLEQHISQENIYLIPDLILS